MHHKGCRLRNVEKCNPKGGNLRKFSLEQLFLLFGLCVQHAFCNVFVEVLLIDLFPFELLPNLQSFKVEKGDTSIPYICWGVEPTFNSSPVCLMFMQTFSRGDFKEGRKKSRKE
jgi:hypothetical protein